MANSHDAFIIIDDLFCGREVLPEVTGCPGPLTVPEWLQSDPEDHEVIEALLSPIGPGLRHVVHLRGDWWHSEFDKILEYYPQLKPRNESNYLDDKGNLIKRSPYSFGSVFPPGYESCLTYIDFPGWQFFSYDEMDMIVKGIKKFLASEEEIIYRPHWEEIILDHEKYKYDLFLFLHLDC